MGRKTFTPEQIIFKLREVEVLVGQGESITTACRKIAVTEQTYYRWRKEYGGMGTVNFRGKYTACWSKFYTIFTKC